MALTLVPYLLGYIYQGARPALGWFSGFTFNATDHCVYLSWMKQAADGGFFQKNLFTTDPQTGHQFNLFYLTLGWLSKLSHLPPNIIYQSARFGLGLGFLRSIWWLLEMWVGDRRARWTAFLIVCFSAGLGWVPGLWEAGILKGPIDTWQPEAITFLSLYLFPLFIVSLLLMVGFIGNMYRASHSGKVKYAANAGICGLLLGNIHTYDVVTIWAVWTIYLVAQWISKKKIETQQVTQAFVAGIPTILTTGYTAYLLKSETVFRQRALVPTIWPAGSAGMILLGFGGLLVFVALVALKKGLRSETSSNAFTLLVTWALVNIAVSFIPISFQRKMIMGAHIPIAMIAGIAVFELTKKLEGRKWQVAVGLICLGFSMTNIRFVLRDIDHLPVNEPGVRSYLYAGELKSLQWIRDNGQPGPIQPLPWAAMADNGRVTFFDNSVACYAPGVTGRAVNAGHWGETPEFGKTMNRWANFIRADIDDSYRQQLLISTGVKYILFSQKHDETGRQEMNDQLLSIFRSGGLPYLHKIAEASNEDCDVYSVDL